MSTEAAPGLAVRPLRPERRMLSFAVSLMKSWGVHRDEYLRLTDFPCLKSQRLKLSPCPTHPKLEVSDEVQYRSKGLDPGYPGETPTPFRGFHLCHVAPQRRPSRRRRSTH